MEILAAAQKELATNTDLDASVDLPLKIIENSNTIPMILVDDKGEIINYQNLDSTKALQPDYVNKQLEIMKNETIRLRLVLRVETSNLFTIEIQICLIN